MARLRNVRIKNFCNLLRAVDAFLKNHSFPMFLIEFEMTEKWTSFIKNVF